jgi:hypothetical protein
MLDKYSSNRKWLFQDEYKTHNTMYDDLSGQARKINQLMNEPLSHRYSPTPQGHEAITDLVAWMDKVEAVVPELHIRSEENRWRERFMHPPEQLTETITPGYLNPEVVMQEIKQALRVVWEDLNRQMLVNMTAMNRLEAELHGIEVEERTLTYGEQSVKFSEQSVKETIKNIRISIWIPVTVFLLGILLSVVVDAFKPEINQILRNVFPSTRSVPTEQNKTPTIGSLIEQ